MKSFGIWIISPSSYEDTGRLFQFRWLLMIPPIFGVMRALINQVAQILGVSFEIICVNDRLERGEKYIQEIIDNKSYIKKLIFISAKTFELPRAIDIARRLKRANIDVVIGGIGVTLADWKIYEILKNEGISFNIGEGEETIPKIVTDFVNNSLKLLYWQRSFVDLSKAPFPDIPDVIGDGYKHGLNPMAGIDTSEGCPFGCSFCCVTLLRGREMLPHRARSIGGVIDWVERTHKLGLPIMFLDDNFRRSPNYRQLLQELIVLNERLGKKLRIFAQLDTAISPSDVRDLAFAGINQVYLGVESLDLDNLQASNKKQNNPENYQKLVEEFHKYKIKVDAGWITGWPNQKAKSIQKEARLMASKFDIVTPFDLVPFPGTKDYSEAVQNNEIVDWDPNNYDTRHYVRKLYNMSPEEALVEIRKGFSIIYSFKHALSGSPGLRYEVFRDTIYCKILVFLGNMKIKRPYQIIMDGIPYFLPPFVMRPADSYRGEPLTSKDLARKEVCLQSML
ncbi:MAG: radical SAM protein [bacterium]|nr:radical SAM protein [bacterium]